MFCMFYDILLFFKYFNKEVHVWSQVLFFLPWYRNWHRESCYLTGIGTDYWFFGIVTPLIQNYPRVQFTWQWHINLEPHLIYIMQHKIPGIRVTRSRRHIISYETKGCAWLTVESCWLKRPPAGLQYLGEEHSPVVLPAAVLTQDVRLFIHQPLLVVHSPLLLIAQHSVQLPQHLQEERIRWGSVPHASAANTDKLRACVTAVC